MGYIQTEMNLNQPYQIDILGYLVKVGKATVTFDDGSGAGGFAAPPSEADKAVLLSSKDDLSGINTLKNSSTATDLIYIDLGGLYQVQQIQWRTRIYFNGSGSSAKFWQYSVDGSTWVNIENLVVDGSDTAYFAYPTAPIRIRYIRVRAYSTNVTNRDFQWGRMVLRGDARTVT